jgi:hypothetical protein
MAQETKRDVMPTCATCQGMTIRLEFAALSEFGEWSDLLGINFNLIVLFVSVCILHFCSWFLPPKQCEMIGVSATIDDPCNVQGAEMSRSTIDIFPVNEVSDDLL